MLVNEVKRSLRSLKKGGLKNWISESSFGCCLLAVLAFTVRVALELVHGREVIREGVGGLAELVRHVSEPAVASEFAAVPITTELCAEVGGEVLQLVWAEL